MPRGSCLCGRVVFELDEAGIAASVGCYCVNCRKVSGSQFGVYLQVRPSAFRWLAGEAEVVTFESSPGNLRGHCRTCGCVAPIKTNYGAVRVPGGALDEDPGTRPDVVLFEPSKAGWCGLDTATQRFEDLGPAEFWRPIVIRLLGST
jgi:hypothetical protein